ncbi:beta-N-acetylhexosaminidase [Polaribacter sp. BAL334]|uniref:beta-N-acetylhexosaminidase n=1 Tax=Polaribacter sp. BAL334 TaxID=1708178 RepID=UPI0018D2027D|nr:beta-N-acetylhexosaminidase [Polaribacter sp. BAL334]MBG7613103.1 beta-N-acetylhexosaminidase [Polaribacter sp. BAL334]
MKLKYSSIFIFLLFVNILNLLSQNDVIIPKPNEISFRKETFQIDENSVIFSDKKSHKSAVLLQKYFENSFDISLKIIEKSIDKKNSIQFLIDEKIAEEGYTLTISNGIIHIEASTEKGWFYGIQTLIQICDYNAFYTKESKSLKLKEVTINDAPRFKWRAFMLDEARYFKGTAQVKLLLDEMAHLKMNVFHWHLTDDQGWRIEIKKYPLLTQIGSKRKSTQIGPLQWDSPIQSGEIHEGFYTQEDIKEIIEYANERHITIVPEIEMPGHSSAAIASYTWLGTSKNEIEVPTKFGVGTDVYDVSDPKVYQFLTDVLEEIMALFPSNVIHIGGDEVKYNHWKSSKSVNDYMKKNNLKTPADLQVYFTNSISNFIKSKNKRMMGWNEILGHNLHYYQHKNDTKTTQLLAKESIIHFWKGDIELATAAASNGYEIVNSLHNFTYLDYNYKNLSLSKAYSFDPIPDDLEEKYHEKIIGLGCQMWGEWIPTFGEMHFHVFPRIAAYAEIGWTKKEVKDFNNFKSNLISLEKRWSEKGIFFAPNAVVEKN